MAVWRRYRRPAWLSVLAEQSTGLGRPSPVAPAPARWWTQPVKAEPDLKACFSTKTAALKSFIEANRQIIDEYGGLDYRVSPSEFDAINHRYGLKQGRAVRTIADALWAAMPAGKPFCLDRIDLEALNDTSPARQRPDAAFRLPDEVYENADAIATEEAAYYRDMEARTDEDAPREEWAPSAPRPTKQRRRPADDPAARAFVDEADETADVYAAAARDATWRPPVKRKRKRRSAPRAPEPVELVWRKTPGNRKPVRKKRTTMAKRIDDSHQPFKRVRKIGPGPKRHPPVLEVKQWKCVKGKKKYTQVCTWIGGGEPRAPTINRMNKAKKKKYNKLYRAWAKRNRNTKGKARSTYRCRKTRNTTCK